MNDHQAWGTGSPPPPYPTWSKLVSTIALLVLSYCLVSLFDVWPNRAIYFVCEWTIYLIPSRTISFVEGTLGKLGWLDDSDRFRKSDFGNQHAKARAIRRIVRRLPVHKAVSRSQFVSSLSATSQTTPPGLGNYDNSCYQNSVLQGLASLPAFRSYIEQCLQLNKLFSQDTQSHQALGYLMEYLNELRQPGGYTWTPSILKSMNSWQQQDAQEYFSKVQDDLEKENRRFKNALTRSSDSGLEELGPYLKSKVIRGARKRRHGEMPEESTAAHEGLKDDTTIDREVYRNPMDGLLAQSLECQTCGFSEGITATPFNFLTVNLGNRISATVEELLDEYTVAEMLDGVECDKCTKDANTEIIEKGETNGGEETDDNNRKGEKHDTGEKDDKDRKPRIRVLRTKAKQITAGRLPGNLVIHVNRSIWDGYGNQRKNLAAVRVAPALDFLSRWCVPLEEEEPEVVLKYALRCIITHTGRHDNGHYVAWAKRGKSWYCFNDEIVTEKTEEVVVSQRHGFMFFYEAIDPDMEVPEETKSDTESEASISTPPTPFEPGNLTESEWSALTSPVFLPSKKEGIIQPTKVVVESPSD